MAKRRNKIPSFIIIVEHTHYVKLWTLDLTVYRKSEKNIPPAIILYLFSPILPHDFFILIFLHSHFIAYDLLHWQKINCHCRKIRCGFLLVFRGLRIYYIHHKLPLWYYKPYVMWSVGILDIDLWKRKLVFCIVYRKCVGSLVAQGRYWAVGVMWMSLVTSISYICSWISGDFVLEWTEMCNSCRLMNAEFISAVVRHKITIHICDKISFTYAGLSWY